VAVTDDVGSTTETTAEAEAVAGADAGAAFDEPEALEAGPRPRRKRVRVPREGPLTPEQGIEAFRRSVERNAPWYPALLDVIARWVASEEVVEGVRLRYLLAGEAFDWLLLAHRLIETLPDGALPVFEVEELLIFGRPPDRSSEDDFAQAIGPQKHRAHLNFQYGVVTEELLLLAVEEEIHKEGRIVHAGLEVPEVAAYERVYGKTLDELRILYLEESGQRVRDQMPMSGMQQFTYWLSKYRLRVSDPARVASDTRKALAEMSRLERARNRLGRQRALERYSADNIVDVRR
jgi:hypothetical protein